MPLAHWLQLSLTQGIGPILTQRLVKLAGSAAAACDATPALLRQVEGIGAARAETIARNLRDARPLAEVEAEKAVRLGIAIICPDDAMYPEPLKLIPDPPSVLYMKASLQPRDLNGIALVGSRKCSLYGREQADRFAGLLAGAGFTIISGGARGIDSSAHRGTIRNPNGRTIAVLGCGVDVVYPPENTQLFEQIAAQGAVLSEYPLATPPLADNFPRRNRIVSGLSRAVLVIEADTRSGALITARQAGEDQGRPVLAIPGPITSPLSAGPHQLIRDGATLVTNLEEILEALDPLPAQVSDPVLYANIRLTSEPTNKVVEEAAAKPAGMSERQTAIYNAIGATPTSVDQIIDATNLEASVIMSELTMLTIKGAIKRADGQSFVRR